MGGKSNNFKDWTDERLRRKASQAWEQAGLARSDGDHEDAARHTKMAREYDDELARRHRQRMG